MNGFVLALLIPAAAGQITGHRRFRECTADSDCAIIPGDTCVAVPGGSGLSICMNSATEEFCGVQDTFLTDADINTGTTLGDATACAWVPFLPFDLSAEGDFSSNTHANPAGGGVAAAVQDLNADTIAADVGGADLPEDVARGLYPCNVFPKHLYKCCPSLSGLDSTETGPRVGGPGTPFTIGAYNGIIWNDGTAGETNRYVPTYFHDQEPRCPCQAGAAATNDANPVLADNALSNCGSSVDYTQNGQAVSIREQCCTMRKFPEWVTAAVTDPDPTRQSHQFPHARNTNNDYGRLDDGTLNAEGEVDFWWQVNGWCFNPLTEKCCDDGTIYNPGTFKCCAVEGVLPISNPCQCASDAHCRDPSRSAAEQRDTACCMEPLSGNPSVDLSAASAHAECDRYHKFHNYGAFALNREFEGRDTPTGNPGTTVRDDDRPLTRPLNCAGYCIDSSYQICCNGAVCQSSSETCCDDVCCNKFSEKCTEGAQQDDLGWLQLLSARNNPHADRWNVLDGSAVNPTGALDGLRLGHTLANWPLVFNSRQPQQNTPIRAFFVDVLQDNHVLRWSSQFFGVNATLAGARDATYTPTAHNLGGEKLYCTRLEEQNAHTMYFAYVWPATLLLAFTLAAGVVLSHLTRWAMRPLSLIEKVVLASAVVSAVFSLPTWFQGSNYVFGIVISWAAFFTLIAVGSGLRKPILVAAIVNLVVFLYIVNPFQGSIAFNTAAWNHDAGWGTNNMIERVFKSHSLASVGTTEDLPASTGSYAGSTHRIVNFAAGNGGATGPADRVVQVYSSYFQLDPRLLDFRSWNPFEMYFGYATRGWTVAVGVFVLISFIALFVQVILLTMAYFLHAHSDDQKGQVESDLLPALEQPPEDVFGADPTGTGFREMDGAPLAARDEPDHLIAARKPLT